MHLPADASPRPRRLSAMRRSANPPPSSPEPVAGPGRPAKSHTWGRESLSLSLLRLQPSSAAKAHAAAAGERGPARFATAPTLRPQSGKAGAAAVPTSRTPAQLFPPAAAVESALVGSLLHGPRARSAHARTAALGALALHAAAASAGPARLALQAAAHAARCGVAMPALAGERLTPAQRAAGAVGSKLGAASPAGPLTRPERERLYASAGPGDVEWVVLASSVAAFLSVFARAIEAGLGAAGSAPPTPGSPKLPRVRSAARGLPGLPRTGSRRGLGTRSAHGSEKRDAGPFAGARAREGRLGPGAPGAWPRLARQLTRRLGHDFPVFRCLRHVRAAKALAGALVRAAEGPGCAISLRVKCLVALVFAVSKGNRRMAAEFKLLARQRGLRGPVFKAVEAFVLESDVKTADLGEARSVLEDARMTRTQQAVLLVAKCCARPPPAGGAEVILEAVAPHLAPEHVAETVTWVATLAALHSVYMFYLPDDQFAEGASTLPM